ncbi:MAG: S8 family serine peptidase, partial [Acidimicrobiales bacterium]
MPRSERHRHRLLLAAAVLVPVLVAGWPPGPPAGARPAGEEAWVVGFRQLPPGLRAGSGYQGARVERVDATLRFAVVRAADAQGFERRARSDPSVRYVEPDPLLPLIATTPNDPRFGDQYGPQQVRAPEAWDTTLGDTDASVCVIDTGVRSTHQDLAGPRWRGGTDFVNNDGDPADDNGHGTHVSGIAAAGVGNGTGIAGLGNVALYAVKALNAQGNGTLSAIASAVRWCADNAGPRTVINMSLSSGLDATAVRDAVAYAQGRGALMVAAAGNGACTNCIGWPAKYAQVMAVTCTTATRSLCSFSSTGPEAELTAPGSSILSLWNTGDTAYNTISGTSMSSPHVAGVAALVWSQATGLTNDQLRQALVDHATDLGAAGRDTQFGYGLVDAAATMGAVAGPPPPPPVTVMAENLDDGVADGFTLGGLWHPSAACATPPSPPNQLGYYRDDTCTYATGARTTGSALVSVDLSGLTAASASFAHRRQVESYAGGAYDVMRVQVSASGGASWTTLQQWDSRNPAQAGWTTQAYSLSAYVGSTVQLRWFFDSIDANYNGFAGWALDDIAVTGTPDLPPANRPPVANAGPDLAAADADGSGA